MHPEVPSLVSDIFCTIGMLFALALYTIICIASMNNNELIFMMFNLFGLTAS